MSDLYAVVEHNQASRQPDDQGVSFCHSLTEAVAHADSLTAENRNDGRRERFLIFRLTEVDESDLYDWAVRAPDGALAIGPYEHQVRAGCPADHTVVRRRLGTNDWTTAPEEER